MESSTNVVALRNGLEWLVAVLRKRLSRVVYAFTDVYKAKAVQELLHAALVGLTTMEASTRKLNMTEVTTPMAGNTERAGRDRLYSN